MESLIDSTCPFIKFEKPITIKEQQASEFQLLTELLPGLNREYTIKEYSTLDEISNIQEWIDQLIEDYKVNSKLNGELVLKVLFDLIKRRLDFSGLLQALKIIISNNKLTQLVLFNYALHHADSQLKVLICITCAYYIPLPLLSFNPWQGVEEKNQLKINSQLLYIYEKSKSIIQFKLLSNQNPYLQQSSFNGCSTLLNNIFGRQFSLHEKNQVNSGQVEIQFDLNCAHVEHLVIADTHGLLNLSTLKQIVPLFDGFIINISEDSFKELQMQQVLDSLYREIGKLDNQEKTILIIKHDSLNQSFIPQNYDKKISENLKIQEISIENLQKLTDSENKILISQISQVFQSFLKIDYDSYKSNTDLRLQTKQIFLDVAKQVNQNQETKQQEAHDQLFKIVNLIKNQENLKAPDFLPMVNYVTKLSKLQKIIGDEQNENAQEKREAQFERKKILKRMKNEQSTEISNLYLEIVNQNSCMKLLPSLSSIVKGLLESKLKQSLEERETKREMLKTSNKNNKEKQKELEDEIIKLNQDIDEKWFSSELLSREIFYLGQYSQKSYAKIDDYYQLVRHFESTAQPFELVDGDTHNFTQNVYQEVFQNYNNEDLLVVCVLGPQSSGKSLLLNYLFGTSYQSSSGRCTKGVYASILRFRTKDGKYKRILILDTEGIQSTEGRDPTFDKRIVYYAICISHVVLMCNKMEMNKPMSETLKLIADAIINTQMPFLKNPSIYIVLNMLTNPNDTVYFECIDELREELRDMTTYLSKQSDKEVNRDSINLLNEVLKIDKESLIPLGQAFNSSQFGLQGQRTVNKSSPDFAIRIMKLREKILQKFGEIESSKSTKYTLTDWFKHAQQFWTFSRDCRSLIQYQTLSQKKMDQEVLFKIEELIKENYLDIWENTLKNEISTDLKNIFKKYQGGSSVKFQSIHLQIQQIIDEKYKNIQDRVFKEYEKFCQKKSVSSDLMNNRLDILNRKRDEFKKDAERFCNYELTKFIEEKSKIVGDTIMQEEVIRLLGVKGSYSLQEARKEFVNSWKKSIEQISNVIMKGDELTKRSKKRVISEFKHQLKTTPQYDKDYFDMARIQSSQDIWLQEILKEFKIEGLWFIGQTMAPSPKRIIDFQEKNNKQFIIDQKVQLFEFQAPYEYFQWWKAFQSIFLKEVLAHEIFQKMTLKDQSFFDYFSLQNEDSRIKSQLVDILGRFKKECCDLGFSFELNEDKFMLFLGTGKKKNKEYQIKTSILNELNKQNNFSFIEIIDPLQQAKRQNSFNFNYNCQQKQNAFKYFKIFISENNYYEVQNYKEVQTEYLEDKGYFLYKINQRIKIKKELQEIFDLNKENINIGSKHLPNFLEEYLDYLINSHYSQPQANLNQSGREYFFDAIEWKTVFQEIEKSVIKNYRTNAEVQDNYMIKYYVDTLGKNNQKSEEIAQHFNKMSSKVAKSIFKDVNEIIKKIDEEIEPFCMNISDKGKEFIFLVTQIFSFLLTEKLEIVNESLPLREYQKTKNREKKLFIAKLTLNNTQMDKSLGEKLADELCTYIYKGCKQKIIRYFQTKMSEKKDAFKKINFIKDLEDQCIKLYDQLIANLSYQPTIEELASKQELIDFYLDPKKFLENKFQQKFKEVSEEYIETCKQDFQESYGVKVNSLIEYFSRLLNKLIETETNKSSTMLFFPKEGLVQKQIEGLKSSDRQYLELQKKAATSYLQKLLQNEWKSDSIIKFDGLIYQQKEGIPPLSSEIENPEQSRFDQSIHNFIGQNFDEKDQISEMHKFVEAVIKFMKKNSDLQSYINNQQRQPQDKLSDGQDEIQSQIAESDIEYDTDIEQFKNIPSEVEESDIDCDQINSQRESQKKSLKKKDFEVIKYEELVGEYLQDFRRKFLGCYEVCPLCRKQCDVAHEEKVDDQILIHDCQLGHQFQGIGGNKDFYNNQAITYSCNNLKDDDDVLYKDQEQKWVELKNSVIKHWNYDKSQESITLARQSQVKIWNLLGREICQHYKNQGLNIIFKAAEIEIIPTNYGKVHYIMMLDDSGSMKSNLWSQLIQGYKEFLTDLQKDKQQQKNSKVTCMLHDDTCRLSFQEQVPDPKLIDNLVPRFQENDFDLPLYKAFDICTNTHQKYQKLVLYFMSDGKWTYPENSIAKFSKDRTFKNKIVFYSVGFGAGSDKSLMERMADNMPNGKVVDAPTAQKLTESFKKVVIESLYGEDR